MSVTVLEKAISLYSECSDMDYLDYADTTTEDILFIYDMITHKGEAETIQWLIDNEYL